jgi:CRP-like cAMP-binding protein
LYGSRRTATVTAKGDTICLSIEGEQLTKILGNNLQQVIYMNTVRIAVDKDRSLQVLTTEQRERLEENFTVKRYQSGEQITGAESQSVTDGLFIILKGSVAHKQ